MKRIFFVTKKSQSTLQEIVRDLFMAHVTTNAFVFENDQ